MSKPIALITGASSGIGRATARTFLDGGYTTIVTARRVEALQETLDGHANGFAIPADMTKPDEVQALFAQIKKDHGRLDVTFNNAGAGVPGKSVEELSWEEWRHVMGVNIDGVFLSTKDAFELMRDQDPRGGRIINNGSVSSYVPRPGSAPYTASKHAVQGLTRSTSLDGRKYNIACGQIDIGNAASEMTVKMASGPGVPQADGSMSQEPVMDVQHVADAVLNMANLPLDANVLFMTIMATKMPYVGRG